MGAERGGDEMKYSVKQARLLAGLTQIQMAEKMGVHRDTYRKIESYPESATIEQGKQISAITGIGFDEIFFDTNSTSSRNKEV